MSNSNRNRDSVDAGLCMNSDGSYVCALSSKDCGNDTMFMSSLELETTPDVHGGDCKSTRKTQGTSIGVCNGENFGCASVPKLCDSDIPLFQTPYEDCTVKTDKVSGNGEMQTKYGSCSSSKFPSDGNKSCFWSNDACDNMSSFKIDDNCTCDKVRVGGCQKKTDPNVIHCAVSPESCDDRSDFLSVVEMKDTNKDCYLCREAPAPPQAPVSPPARSPSSAGCSIGEIPDGGCSVCGPGMCVTNSDAVFEFPGQPSVKCGDLENAGLGGIVPLNQCGFLPSLIKNTCECQSSQSNPSPPVSSPVRQPTPSPVRRPTSSQPGAQCSIDEVPDGGCSVCGPGMCVTNSDAVFEFPGQPSVKCGDLEYAGLSGIVPLDQCGFLPGLILDTCKCRKSQGSPSSPVSSPVRQPTRPPFTTPAGELPPALSIGENENKSSNTAGIVGGIVGAAVVSTLLLVVVMRKLRRSKDPSNPPPVTTQNGGDYA